MLRAAFENQKAVFSIQPTDIPVFQKFDTGMHINVDPNTAHSPYTIRTPIITLQSLTILGAVKIRLYWKTIEILVNTKARLYVGIVAQRHFLMSTIVNLET